MLCHTVTIVLMRKELLAVIFLLFLCVALSVFFVLDFGFDGADRASPDVALTPAMDSEKLLYDDAFMDEMLQLYSLRSLTASLSRLGSVKGIDCHDRAHELGRRAYETVGSEAFKSCGIECHSGCRHGATEAFFADKGTSDLISGMGVLCGDEMGNKFHMHQCIHGIGHGLMAWYDYDLHKALQACDLIEHPFHQGSCYSGVFMENIVGSIVRDKSVPDGEVYHHTDFLSDDPHYPCNAIADRYKWQCYWGQTDRMLQLSGNINLLGDFCAESPEFVHGACFHSMGRTTSGFFSRDIGQSFAVCDAVPDAANRNICMGGVLSDLFWDQTHADRAVAFCEMSLNTSFEERCYENLIIRASETVSDVDMRWFCEKLPDAYYEQCAHQETPRAFPISTQGDISPVAVEKTDTAVIRYVDGRYVPDAVHISVGQEVVWVNEDGKRLFWPASNIHPTHTAYPGSAIQKCGTDEQGGIFDACEGLPRGAEYSFVFTEVGQWRFHDHINPRAAGTVIVSE